MTRRRPAPLLLIPLLAAAIGGCEKRVVRDTWTQFAEDTGAQVSDGRRTPTANHTGAVNDPARRNAMTGWSIPLQHFDGPGRERRAKQLITQVQTSGVSASLPMLWIDDRRGRATVYCGRYAGMDRPEAQDALGMVRAIELDGVQPFTGVTIQPLGGEDQVAIDPFDISAHHGLYSLQIAVFDDDGGKQFRRAAEAYVRQLREQGDPAYYYHGPNRSMVTVGLFRRDQAFVPDENPLSPGTQIERYAPAVKTLQDKFPFNIYNGYTVLEKQNGHDLGEQPSTLIHVP